MKCDKGTILDSGYTLNPKSEYTEEHVEALLKKGKKNWTSQEKKQFKQATFGSNKYSVSGIILFLVVTVLVGQLIGSIIGLIAVNLIPNLYAPDPKAVMSANNPLGLNTTGLTVFSVVGFVGLFVAIIIFDKPFLNTNLRHLIAGRKKFDWKLFFYTFVCFFVVAGVVSSIAAWGNLKLEAIDFAVFLPFALFSLVFLPIQTTTEELYFRCFLSRVFYRNNLPKWPKALILVVASGVLFVLPHLSNPEVLKTTEISNTILAALTYFVPGAGLMAAGLISRSFASSVAFHAANNIFVSIVAREEISALNTPAIFINYTTENLELIGLVSTIVMNVIMVLLVWAYTKWQKKKSH